jgi:hypothetical protein
MIKEGIVIQAHNNNKPPTYLFYLQRQNTRFIYHFIIICKMTLFDKFSNNSKYIPGIYNYCDRWCERCAFTSRCLNFEMSEEKFGDLESVDITNKAFWKKLGETLDETLNMLREMAEEQGIDLDSIDIVEDEKFQRRFDKNNVVHLLSHMSKVYITLVDDWFDSNAYLFEQNEDQIHTNPGLYEISSPPQKDTVTVIDSIEVIRSHQKKNIIGIITYLERLRKRTENEFPDARAFVRPGFDEN